MRKRSGKKYKLGLQVPKRVFRRLLFSEDYLSTAVSTGRILRRYRCMGAADPRYETGGVPPQSWQFYKDRYQHYVVHGAKIKYTLIPVGNGAYMHALVSTIDDNGVAVIPQPSTAVLFPDRYRVDYWQGGFNTTTKPWVVTRKFSPKKFFGKSRARDSSNYTSSTGSVPADDQVFSACLYALPVTGTLPPLTASWHIKVQVEYLVEFYEIRDQVWVDSYVDPATDAKPDGEDPNYTIETGDVTTVPYVES